MQSHHAISKTVSQIIEDLRYYPTSIEQLRDVAYDIFTDPVSVYPGVPSEVI